MSGKAGLTLKQQLLREVLRLKLADKEHAELKRELHEEVDLQKESKKLQQLRQERAALERSERRLGGRCCYELPDWGGSGPQWRPLAGVEVEYTAAMPPAGPDLPCVQCSDEPAACRGQIYHLPFSQGANYEAYYFRDEQGRRYVLKGLLIERPKPEENTAIVDGDAKAAAICQLVAQRFMQAAKTSSASAGAPASLAYARATVLVVEDSEAPRGQAVFLKEEWMESKWVKWTRNDGHVFPAGASDPVIQAFTHYSFLMGKIEMGEQLAILDAQGTKTAGTGGGGAAYMLTDPALCSESGRFNLPKLGGTDLGLAAVKAFFGQHICNPLCTALGCSSVRP